jgi:transposase
MNRASNKGVEERLDKVIKRLDVVTVILLANSGLTRKDIAQILGVSEKTIERLVSISKIRRAKGKKLEPDIKDETYPSQTESSSCT